MSKVILSPAEIEYSEEVRVLNNHPESFRRDHSDNKNNGHSERTFTPFIQENEPSAPSEGTLSESEPIPGEDVSLEEHSAVATANDPASTHASATTPEAPPLSEELHSAESHATPTVPPPPDDTVNTSFELSGSQSEIESIATTPDDRPTDNQALEGSDQSAAEDNHAEEGADEINGNKSDPEMGGAPTPPPDEAATRSNARDNDTTQRAAPEYAEQLLNEFRKEASVLVQHAKDEAEQIRERAREIGTQEGYTQSLKENNEAFDFTVRRLQAIAGDMLAKRTALLSETQNQMVELVLLIAHKVVKKISTEERGIVVENVRAALKLLESERRVEIRVHPDDLAHSHVGLKELTSALESERTISFYADPNVERGGCVIETDLGNIDARISSQFLELERQIRAVETARKR